MSRGSDSASRRILGRTNANAREIHPGLRTSEFPAGRRKLPARRGGHQTPALPDAAPPSDRPRCGGRESKFRADPRRRGRRRIGSGSAWRARWEWAFYLAGRDLKHRVVTHSRSISPRGMAIATLFCKASETSERSAVRIFLNIQRSYGWTGAGRGWGDMGVEAGRRWGEGGSL